ncbi:hypothetical protein PCL_11436 [Purpureocillium lilacinum]|uniref:Uncharacterized protein n=1 Tax=Purpureocillium lilacinum TaxID=33203 RepID=A0A2U3EA23_PURLI|nr:hypothetical protein Purlil1_2698 [Purpureocillium lilacinum]PWI71342.1 hypothetical protein PCL_11436 [Purpureocillium lilacinum]
MYVSRCAAALRPPANGPGSVSFRGAAGRGPPSGRKDRLRSESPGAAELFTHTRTMHTYTHSAYPPACPRPTAQCDDAPSNLDPASPWQHTHPPGKGGQGRIPQPMPTKATTPMHPASTASWYISLPGSAGGEGPELRRSQNSPSWAPKASTLARLMPNGRSRLV